MSSNNLNEDGNLSFEDAYTLLEEKVSTLEQGGLSLEESILLFEQGMKLLNVCFLGANRDLIFVLYIAVYPLLSKHTKTEA